MNFIATRWGYGSMAAVCGVVMAFAMSQRYGDWIIFWIGAPLVVALCVGLMLWSHFDEQKIIKKAETRDE